MRRQLRAGDKVKYTYSDGSFDEGTVTGNLRKDGYYPVRMKDCLFGVQLIKPSHLKLNNKKARE